MKKLLLVTTVALLAFAANGSAYAADMPLKAMPAPLDEWTGFYLGLNGGYSWGRSDTEFSGAGFTPFSRTQDMNGGVFGGQIGHNWQVNRDWVFGIETDFQGTGQDGTAALPTVVAAPIAGIALFPVTTTGSLSERLDWFGTLRLRLGYEVTKPWIIYATGGLAYGQIDTAATVTATPAGGAPTTVTANASNTQIGWTIGAGTEWKIWDRWTAKLEYIYIDFGTFANTFTGTGAFPTFTAVSHVNDNIFRAGINYRFGS
jgi:outer membrane immunogenic protein